MFLCATKGRRDRQPIRYWFKSDYLILALLHVTTIQVGYFFFFGGYLLTERERGRERGTDGHLNISVFQNLELFRCSTGILNLFGILPFANLGIN